jgi:hypothetical protein
MKTLYNVCTSTKLWREFPEGTHNDTCAEENYFDYIHDFISDIKSGHSMDEIKPASDDVKKI